MAVSTSASLPAISPGASSDAYYSAKWRKTLLVAIPFGALAFVLGWLLEHPSDQATAFDLVSYPIMATALTALWGLLLARPHALRFVVLGIIAGAGLFFALKLAALLLWTPAGIDIQHQLTETFYWVPVVYLLSFVLPGVRAGRWMAIAFTLVVVVVSAAYAIPKALAGEAWGVVYALIQLNLANTVLLALTSAFISFKEVYDRTQSRAEMAERFAYTDPLTGLPNRHSLEARLEHALARAERDGSKVALLFIDVDGFKLVNDTLGHEAGDALLCQLAERLKGVVRGEDFVARISGDEFVLLAEGTQTLHAAYFVAQKLQAAMVAPFWVADQPLSVTLSIGISLYPDDTRSIDELLKHADSAMYRVKRSGKNGISHYRGTSDAELEHQQQLERELRAALQEEQLSLAYQPLHELRSGRLVKLEALLRWHHPQRGQIPPSDFIPIAERSGLIVPLGAWVLDAACKQAKAWQLGGLERVKVAVNVSPLQFSHPSFVSTVMEALERHHLAPEALELELTEGMVMHGVEHVTSKLEQLKRLGVGLAIDDFGTGYSSLAYLRDLPIDSVKIDRSFVRDLGAPRRGPQFSLALIEAIVGLAAHLDLEVVAEGIETEVQLELLRNLGCELGQGYYFAAPMAAPALAHYLLAGRAATRSEADVFVN